MGNPSYGNGVDWMGGESGPGPLPMDWAWVQEIHGQCRAAQVPFFFKQRGGVRKKRNGHLLGGRTWGEMPAAVVL